MSQIQRGDIFWLDLGQKDEKTGHVMTDLHPIIVVQCAEGNDSSPLTIIVPGTSQFRGRLFGWECVLEAGEGGLTSRTRFCCNQIRTIEKNLLEEENYIGQIPPDKIRKLNDALKYSLQIPRY